MSTNMNLRTYSKRTRAPNTSQSTFSSILSNKTKGVVKRKKKKIEIKELPPRSENLLMDDSLHVSTEDAFDKLLKGDICNHVKFKDNISVVDTSSDISKSASVLKGISNTYHLPIIMKKTKVCANLSSDICYNIVPNVGNNTKQTENISDANSDTYSLPETKSCIDISLSVEVLRQDPVQFKTLSYIQLPQIKEVEASDMPNNNENTNIFSNSMRENLLIHSSTPCAEKSKRVVCDLISPIKTDLTNVAISETPLEKNADENSHLGATADCSNKSNDFSKIREDTNQIARYKFITMRKKNKISTDLSTDSNEIENMAENIDSDLFKGQSRLDTDKSIFKTPDNFITTRKRTGNYLGTNRKKLGLSKDDSKNMTASDVENSIKEGRELVIYVTKLPQEISIENTVNDKIDSSLNQTEPILKGVNELECNILISKFAENIDPHKKFIINYKPEKSRLSKRKEDTNQTKTGLTGIDESERSIYTFNNTQSINTDTSFVMNFNSIEAKSSKGEASLSLENANPSLTENANPPLPENVSPVVPENANKSLPENVIDPLSFTENAVNAHLTINDTGDDGDSLNAIENLPINDTTSNAIENLTVNGTADDGQPSNAIENLTINNAGDGGGPSNAIEHSDAVEPVDLEVPKEEDFMRELVLSRRTEGHKNDESFSTIIYADGENLLQDLDGFTEELLPAKRVVLKSGKPWRRELSFYKRKTMCIKQGMPIPSRLSVKIVPVPVFSKVSGRPSILESYACVRQSLAAAAGHEPAEAGAASSKSEGGDPEGGVRDDVGQPAGGVTARDVVLRRCGQTEPLPFEECYPDSRLEHCQKIGEGVYGEVFLFRDPDIVGGGTTVMKVIPIEGDLLVNGERQKRFDEIISEIVIAMELTGLRRDGDNRTEGFSELRKVRCTKGRYPDKLLELWELYDETKGSENDSPSVFGDDQLYVVLELADGGRDLEAYTFNNAYQAYCAFRQVAFSLAAAEAELKFEHRDLHWGNVLLKPTDKKHVSYDVGGRRITVETGGVQVSIIDFTLSRMECEGVVMYNDLSQDEDLFTADDNDIQFETYKLMRNANDNNWERFEPLTNILWLDYLLEKAVSGFRYKNRKSKVHREYQVRLVELRRAVFRFKSVRAFVEDYDYVLR